MPRRARFVLGLALAAFGLLLVFSPLEVAEVLNRPPGSKPAMINLRATWGGTVLGLGLFLAWLPALRPWGRTLIGFVGWVMAGVGFARLCGFVLDGGPDGKQWTWLIAEILIAIASAIVIRRGAR